MLYSLPVSKVGVISNLSISKLRSIAMYTVIINRYLRDWFWQTLLTQIRLKGAV